MAYCFGVRISLPTLTMQLRAWKVNHRSLELSGEYLIALSKGVLALIIHALSAFILGTMPDSNLSNLHCSIHLRCIEETTYHSSHQTKSLR